MPIFSPSPAFPSATPEAFRPALARVPRFGQTTAPDGLASGDSWLPAKRKARKTLIVLNPQAGGGRSPEVLEQRIIRQLQRLAQAHPDAVDLRQIELTTLPPELLQRKLEQDPTLYRRLIAAGGDGTANQVIGLARRHHLSVGLLPLGTANRLAAVLGLPTQLPKALQIALTGQTRRLDVMEANGRPALLTAHTGISQQMIARTNQYPRLKKALGLWAYPAMGLDLLARFPTRRYRITTENQTLEVEAAGVAVINGLSLGPLPMLPGARSDDGWLDIAVYGAQGQRLSTLWHLFSQRPRTDENTHAGGILHVKARQVEIEALETETEAGANLLDIDGDPAGQGKLTVRLAGHIEIAVPPKNDKSKLEL